MKKIALLWLLAATAAMSSDRVFSQSNAGTIQPVLVTFNASLGNYREVHFTWTVQQQFITDVFTIEKSTDGLYWASIATIKSTSFSSKPVTYNAVDNMPVKGSNLYRLRISSMDGNSIYTVVKHIHVTVPVSIRLYPNPSADIVTISLARRPVSATWGLWLIDAMGRAVVQRQYYNSETKICLPVNGYPNGHYTIQICDGNTKEQTALLINHQ